jgi:hypothetical protein
MLNRDMGRFSLKRQEITTGPLGVDDAKVQHAIHRPDTVDVLVVLFHGG